MKINVFFGRALLFSKCLDGSIGGGVAYFSIFGTYYDVLSVQGFFFEHTAFGKLQSVVHFLGKVEYLFI